MSVQQPPTAYELGLMRAFPPAPDKLVTRANQFHTPYNRWSFQNEEKLNPSATIWRGTGPVAELHKSPMDLDLITFEIGGGTSCSFGDMVNASYTDGILVLHHGEIVYERYLNGLGPQTRHAWASCSKSMTGTLAALLMHEDRLNPEAPVTHYLPELKDSAFAGATIRQVMDMTTALKFSDDYGDPAADTWRYNIAMGLYNRPEGYTGPQNIYEFLPTMRRDGRHGDRFAYVTPNSDVLAWLMKRVLDQPLADIMQERIWSGIGAEQDAAWLVDAAGAESAGSGLLTTLRDMARFGQMLLQDGSYNGRQILPAVVVEDIRRGGDREAFARGPAAGPMNRGQSYHHQWWITHNAHGAYFGLGYGGQILFINPAAQMVVAKFSSYPSPAPGGEEFYLAIAGIRALGKAFAP
jgi:CubicO group peptidase (beta-lactamase class C family)